MSNRTFYIIVVLSFLAAMGFVGKLINNPPQGAKSEPRKEVSTQYDNDRGFCNQWQGFCRNQGLYTPEMMK